MPTLLSGPVSCPTSPGAERPARSAGASRPKRAAGWGAMRWLPSSRWAHDQPRGDFARGSTRHRRRNLVGARDRAALTALGAQEGPRRRVVSPQVVGMRLTGRAP